MARPMTSKGHSKTHVAAGVRARRWLGWVLFGLYFLAPLGASIYFTLFDRNDRFTAAPYTGLFKAAGFTKALQMSVGMGVLTVVILLALLLPAMIAIQLALPRLRPLVEVLCTLPLVIPPISFAAGIIALQNTVAQDPYGSTAQFLNSLENTDFPLILVFVYVILALPFAYRALDSGLRMLPLRTLVDASRGLGASWPTVLLRVIMPNLRAAIMNAAILTLALVLGEFTIANLLGGYEPFPVWIVSSGGEHAQNSTAASIVSLLFTWVALLIFSIAGDRRSRTARSAS